MAESSRDISGLGFEALKVLLVQALEDNARLKAENVELREEIARLKGVDRRQQMTPLRRDNGSCKYVSVWPGPSSTNLSN